MAHEGLKTLGACLTGMVLASCASAPPPRPAPPRPPPVAPTAPAGFADRDWGLVSSQRFLLAVPVPEATAWATDDRSGRWFIALHRPSKSILILRSWREGSVVDHRGCESAARLWRPDLFGHDESQLVDRRPVGAPAHFDTEVGFTVRRDGSVLQAVAAAFGANIRNCIAMAFVTRVEGQGADRAAADRLLFATTKIFSRVEATSIEDRVHIGR